MPTPPDRYTMAPEVLAHYSEGLESERLTRKPIGKVEYERTQRLLARILPAPPAVVMDIGGGTGVHAFPLARRGYAVHLIEPVELHVQKAREASQATRDARLTGVHRGDARDLPFPVGSADAVLLLGPLYHLTERADRLLALREACRVLRPGGVLFVAAISRYASLLNGFARTLIDDPAFVELMVRDLRDGQHRNPLDHTTYFTTAFFHHPDELRAEVTEAGFGVQLLAGIEGPSWAIPDLDALWADDSRRESLLGLLGRIETDPMVVAASVHIMAVGTTTVCGQ